MPRAGHDGIEIEYDVRGGPDDPALVLLNDFGDQLVDWDDDLVDAFVDRGFRVVRLDNREAGLSTRTTRPVDVRAAMRNLLVGSPAEVPFTLDDLAGDVVAVLDALAVDRAHLLGVSLGGMIAQTVAIRHPDRVASLTSAQSTTGEPDVGGAQPEVLPFLVARSPADRDGAVAHALRFRRIVGSPSHFDEDRVRRRLEAAYDRAFHPDGAGLQVLAATASGSRRDGLAALDVPTLVVHGDRDPMVALSGGERTAELIAGAELLVLEGVAHDLPTHVWPVLVESVTRLAARVAS